MILQKCSKPVLKISFNDQTWVTHTWNAILVLRMKMGYRRANFHLLQEFPAVPALPILPMLNETGGNLIGIKRELQETAGNCWKLCNNYM